MKRWPHQIEAPPLILDALAEGHKRVVFTCPTGGGKTRIMLDVIEAVVREGWCVSVNTNRRMLLDQLRKNLAAGGIPHGVRAAGEVCGWNEPVQLCSLQTMRSRVVKKGTWAPHGDGSKTLVIVDEAHVNVNPTTAALADHALAQGGALLGITATPIGLFPMYANLIQAGTTSSLRDCGALVLAHHYGVDEPDLARIRREKREIPLGEDLTRKEQVRAIMTPTIFARVIDSWRQLNPEQKPTLLSGPGKPEALFFAERFWASGIPAAHIDGETVWLCGKTYHTDEKVRAEVAAMSRDGRVKVVTNRFVLREGVDWPWIEHLILACVLGSLQSYLQFGGRGLRASPGKDHLTVQDHGGAWWRHGSLNSDREWHLEWTGRMYAAQRAEGARNPQPDDGPQPGRCPQCMRIMNRHKCLGCGYLLPAGSTRSRPVVEIDGSLREMKGDAYRPRVRVERPGDERLWERMYYRACSPKWNASWLEAEALFYRETGRWPMRNLPLMPSDPLDWMCKVAATTPDRLILKPEGVLT